MVDLHFLALNSLIIMYLSINLLLRANIVNFVFSSARLYCISIKDCWTLLWKVVGHVG